MKDKVLGFYRKLVHNINYKEGYFRNLMLLLGALLLLDLIMLYYVR